VDCAHPGAPRAAFVCHHGQASLSRHEPVWRRNNDGCVNAYGSVDETYDEPSDGEGTENAVKFAGNKLICDTCFEPVATLNGIEELH